MVVPIDDWNLLVPRASCGSMPVASNIGTVSKPPPPAMASTQPATNPVAKRAGYHSQESSMSQSSCESPGLFSAFPQDKRHEFR